MHARAQLPVLQLALFVAAASALAASVSLVSGCAAGTTKLASTQPPTHASGDALGESKCGAPTSTASAGSGAPGASLAPLEPLLVDWPSTSRAKLEALSHKALVVVRYQACTLEVLGNCKAKGSYLYTAITHKHDRVKIGDEADLWANVPLGAASLAGKLASHGELNVAMTIVGRYAADRLTIAREELDGDCARATHVVAAMVAGAFDFVAGAGSSTEAGVSALGVGAGGKSAASFERLNSDGDAKKCSNGTLADTAPPDGCGALLRLELTPIGATSSGASLAKSKEPACPEKTAWDGAQCVRTEIVTQVECPTGSTAEGDKCVSPAVAPTVTQLSKGCRYGDATDCLMQCNVGKDAASCADLALMFVKGEGIPADEKKAMTFYLRACDFGSALGCNQAGMRVEDGIGTAKDDAKAAALYQKACDAAKPDGCTNLARMYANGWGLAKDEPHAVEILTRACNLGDPSGCSNLGFFYVKGRGCEVDHPRGVSLLRKGCLAGNKWGCEVLFKIGEKT